MKRHLVLLASLLLAAVSVSAIARAEDQSFKEGQDFITVKPAVKVPGVKQPYVIEYLWLGCPHCQAMNPIIEHYEHEHPKVKFVRRPAIGKDRWVFDAHVFYALQETGNGELIYKIMEFYHNLAGSERRLPDKEDLKPFLTQHHIDADKFYKAMDSDATLENLSAAYQDQEALGIKGVPTFLVGGQYIMTLASITQAKDPQARFEALMNYLVEKTQHN
ncbi:DsbA family protein [Shewanella sp. A32]|uniref:DsbA family protein n=1 Tax=Shewanella sp. A32 TaxID=3031327 RepID=UPI0023BA3024|nr:DsbA family protein [Shewanella sp. A32]MDF0532841.1 DsbA family protein [Shewanella sp. A32]